VKRWVWYKGRQGAKEDRNERWEKEKEAKETKEGPPRESRLKKSKLERKVGSHLQGPLWGCENC